MVKQTQTILQQKPLVKSEANSVQEHFIDLNANFGNFHADKKEPHILGDLVVDRENNITIRKTGSCNARNLQLLCKMYELKQLLIQFPTCIT